MEVSDEFLTLTALPQLPVPTLNQAGKRRSRSELHGGVRNLFPLPGIEAELLDYSACYPVAIPTESNKIFWKSV